MREDNDDVGGGGGSEASDTHNPLEISPEIVNVQKKNRMKKNLPAQHRQTSTLCELRAPNIDIRYGCQMSNRRRCVSDPAVVRQQAHACRCGMVYACCRTHGINRTERRR